MFDNYVSTPAGRNIIKKQAEKNMYLSIEIQRMWGMKVTVIPVIIVALEITSKGLQGHEDHLLGCHLIPDIQRTAVLETPTILRRTL